MTPDDSPQVADEDTTRPPLAAIRFETLQELYAGIPQTAELIRHRPMAEDTYQTFLNRLRGSTTPEEAVTFTAFAAQPQMAIWWAHECLRNMAEALTPLDHQMMALVANWIGRPDKDTRHAAMKEALWAPMRTPGVFLALATGWSGGSIAPNDPAPVPLHRTPRAINTAIMSCLAKAPLHQRPVLLARFIDMADSILRV